MNFQWTAEAIDKLLAMHNAGKTSYEICRAIGVTRNAVIGKLHRELLKQGKRGKAPRKRVLVPAHLMVKAEKPSKPAKVIGTILPKLPVPVPPPRTDYVSIVDCTGCKWPVADDPSLPGRYGFCNRDKADHRYCAEHKALSGGTVAPTSWLVKVA